jgi:uncharacterized protein YndB with AHSA1/START domain
MEPITIETTVNAPMEKVWQLFNEPEHIVQWATASDDWHTTKASNDVRVGGTFSYRMEAKDGSQGFDLTSIYSEVVPDTLLAYTMADGRNVRTVFTEGADGVHIAQTFDPETENPVEMQRAGWQTILDNFKAYAETH